MDALLLEGHADANALVRGTWGAAPVPGLEAQPGDHLVEKSRMSAWEGRGSRPCRRRSAATSSS